MKITGMTVIFTYENGETQDVSSYIPDSICRDLEDFADFWQEEDLEQEEEIEDEEEVEE